MEMDFSSITEIMILKREINELNERVSHIEYINSATYGINEAIKDYEREKHEKEQKNASQL
jgi:hypothetical protein